MLAYLAWHRPGASADAGAYEQALERFHRSLAHTPPAGFRGSFAFRARELPWLAGGAPGAPGYEDWYLLEDWTAVGVIEEAAVSRQHLSAHERVAGHAAAAVGGIYRLIEGRAALAGVRLSVWVERSRGHEDPSIASLLADGMDPQAGCLWQRCLGLGPAPGFCLLARESSAGVSPRRLPEGWSASTLEREALWPASAAETREAGEHG